MDDADEAFESVSVLGSALIFLFEQEFDDDKQPAADPYVGLWMDREPMVDDYERYLYALSYHNGMSYLLGGEESPGLSWVDLTSSEEGATGSFGTIYWNGDFEAEDCGSLSFGGGGREPEPEEVGDDTDGYDLSE